MPASAPGDFSFQATLGDAGSVDAVKPKRSSLWHTSPQIYQLSPVAVLVRLLASSVWLIASDKEWPCFDTSQASTRTRCTQANVAPDNAEYWGY